MSPIFQFGIFLVIGIALINLSFRLFVAGKKTAAQIIAVASLLLVMYGVNAWHYSDKKAASEKLSAAFVILEDTIKDGNRSASLQVVDRGVILFGSSRTRLDHAVDEFWKFAIKTKTTAPNQAPETTILTVTDRAPSSTLRAARSAPARIASHLERSAKYE